MLSGILTVPKAAKGLVLFAHGSGSSRFSPRNTFVARELQQSNLATLLIDLLSEAEDALYAQRFNIDLLTDRLTAVVKWVAETLGISDLPLGIFGASTGAASALRCAAKLKQVKAVVARGGRPDLAADFLDKVSAPVLLIVGGHDEQVLELNRIACKKLKTTKKLVVIPGASHLFEEAGALEQVAEQAAKWFTKYLY